MIFSQLIKNKVSRHDRLSNGSQAGVSLMLAVLVLSAVTAVAFSLAVIVFIEIRASGDSARTEPALYATFGVTEEALFQYKRFYTGSGMNVPGCSPTVNNICFLNGVTLSLPGTQPIEFDESPRVEFVGADTTITLPMYQVDTYEQQYESVTIEVLDNNLGSGVDVYLLQTSIDGTVVCADGGDPEPCDLTTTVLPGEQYQFTAFATTGEYQYELVLHNTSSSQDVSVSITTVRVGGAEPAGLPFVGEQVLRIMANYLGLTRTYQVRIPIP